MLRVQRPTKNWKSEQKALVYLIIYIYSKFCGMSICKRCGIRSRRIPGSKSTEKYRICEICESKYFMQAMIQNYSEEIKYTDQILKSIKDAFMKKTSFEKEVMKKLRLKAKEVQQFDHDRKQKLKELKVNVEAMENKTSKSWQEKEILMSTVNEVSKKYKIRIKQIEECEKSTIDKSLLSIIFI